MVIFYFGKFNLSRGVIGLDDLYGRQYTVSVKSNGKIHVVGGNGGAAGIRRPGSPGLLVNGDAVGMDVGLHRHSQFKTFTRRIIIWAVFNQHDIICCLVGSDIWYK
ncbi:MAG: hypothetical protein II819_09630 [Fibrobacter sp.]|nr:hypothetical protein [Fibrobacter sp.]